jgi:hypothetical protein
MEALAVFGGHRVRVGGADRDELAVYLGGEVIQAAGHVAGVADPDVDGLLAHRCEWKPVDSRSRIPSVTASMPMTNRTFGIQASEVSPSLQVDP